MNNIAKWDHSRFDNIRNEFNGLRTYAKYLKPNVSFIISKKLLENSLFIMSYSLLNSHPFYNTPETIIIKKNCFSNGYDWLWADLSEQYYLRIFCVPIEHKQNFLFYSLKVMSESILLNQYIYSLLKIKTGKKTHCCVKTKRTKNVVIQMKL